MKCPNCKGKKKIYGIVFKPEVTERVVALTCNLCDGKGIITAQQKKWAVEGERMYQDRIARGFTLRLEARRRGIDGCVLSDMETGKIKPVWDKEKYEDKNRVRK
jgi:hypothetical protein